MKNLGDLENSVKQLFEELQLNGTITINGPIDSTIYDLSRKASEILLLSDQQRLIYNSLNFDESGKSTKEIAKLIEINSKNVSVQLSQIEKKTNLIKSKNYPDRPRLKFWFKIN